MGESKGIVGLVVGTSALGPGGEQLEAVAAEHGLPIVQRHGGDPYTPPHLIDHGENMAALAAAGCDRVLAVSSVGSVRPGLGVGSLLCPDDYIALDGARSIFADARGHGTRDLAGPWRDEVVAAWSAAGGPRMADGGVYWQSAGPRFETPAEIRLIAPHADVVGMTVASECVAAADTGLAYAAVCAVDNLANGLDPEPLTLEGFERGRAAGLAGLRAGLAAVLPRLVAQEAQR